MKIYLSHARKAATTHTEFLDDLLYPQTVHWFPDTYAKVKTGMFYVPHLMANKVLDQELASYIRENPVGKTAFILSVGTTNIAGSNNKSSKETRLSYTYKFLPFTLTQVYAGKTAQMFGANDMVITDSSACASSLKVMMDVQNLIKHYGFDRVVVLAIEDQVSNLSLDFFGEAKATLSAEEDKTIKPSAFDSVNYGFHVGQGAALAIFDAAHVVEKTGDNPIAELKGAYTASEPIDNIIGQRQDGQGFKRAIEGAAFYSNVSLNDIKVVKTHGTGTKSNNIAEKAALLSTLKEFVATSYKPRIGHTTGVSGLLESLMLFDDMKNGYVPEILNRTEHDKIFLSDPAIDPKGYIISLAAGMGSIYSAAIFKRM